MRNILLFLGCLLLLGCEAQVAKPAEPASTINGSQIAAQFDGRYERYREATLTDRRFKHEDLQPLLAQLPAAFRRQPVGQSIEGRRIDLLSWGNGPVPVLLWSQMHGDEATATAALFDIFNMLQGSDDGLDEVRNRLRDSLTLHFVPMLNPDGAAAFTRRNALGVDLNRDALRLTNPETALLKAVRDSLSAQWGFNLHDQNRYYGAGYPMDQPATISLLAPAYDFDRSVNTVRGEAMQLIVLINSVLQALVPGGVARWDDAFEPRAFGDNMQKWGTRTVLIESGGYPGDPEKQTVRRFNFTAILAALDGIASRAYRQLDREAYDRIPENKSYAYFDLLLREVEMSYEGQRYRLDLGFRDDEYGFADDRRFYVDARLDDLGDLSYFRGYTELDGAGLRAVPGREAAQPVDRRTLGQLEPRDFYRRGVTAIRVTDWTPALAADYQGLRLLRGNRRADDRLTPGAALDLLLYDTAGALRYVVVNGRLIDLRAD
jgi:hypothetical protein